MATTYSGDEGNNPTDITIPSDGDENVVASVNAAFEGLMDKVKHALLGETEFDGAKTFLDTVEFAANILLGAVIVGTNVPTSRVLLATLPVSGSVNMRIYSRGVGSGTAYPSAGLDITFNASWSTVNDEWTADSTAAPARLIEVMCLPTAWAGPGLTGDEGQVSIKRKNTTSSPWDQDNWDSLILGLNASNPSATSSAVWPNTLYSKGISKSWGRVSVTGGNGTINIRNGLGIASIVVDSASLLVTLRTAMADAYFAPLAIAHSSAYIALTVPLSTTQFRIEFRAYPGAGNLDPATNNSECSFHVLGEQS